MDGSRIFPSFFLTYLNHTICSLSFFSILLLLFLLLTHLISYMNSPQDQGRRPRNAAPIPLPPGSSGHHPSFTAIHSPRSSYYSDANYSFGSGVSESINIRPQPEMRPISPSGYSEIEVVLDDGTLQRRTVSLSTTFDSRFHDMNDPPLEHNHDRQQYDRLYQHQDNNDNVRPSNRVMPER
jgi:hypothetical protein